MALACLLRVKMKKLIDITIIVIYVILSIVLLINIIINFPRSVKSIGTYTVEVNIDFDKVGSNNTVRDQISNYFKINHSYKEVDNLSGLTLGYSNILFKKVFILSHLEKDVYGIVLTHELMHIKYFTADERYVNFMTFKNLYESNNDTLVELGKQQMKLVLEGFYPERYNCSDDIYNYFKNKNIYNIKRIN